MSRPRPKVDVDGLPHRIMLDSGVLIRALGDRPDDSESPMCVALWDALIAHNRTVLVAAPTLVEILRTGGKSPPVTPNAQVVAFDQLAAIKLAAAMPMTDMKRYATDEYSSTRLKYDALIIACALRHRAEVLVTLEKKKSFHDLAELAGVTTENPDEYAAPQYELFPP